MRRLYITTAVLTRTEWGSKDIASVSHLALAGNADEARGVAVADMASRYPGFAIEGCIVVEPIDDGHVRAAARELGMMDP